MTPVVRFVLAFVLGLAGGLRLGHTGLAVAGVAAGGAAGLMVLLGGSRSWMVVAAIGTGALHGALAAVAAVADCRARLPDGASLEASVHFHAFVEAGVVVPASLESVRVAGQLHPCKGTVRVRLPAGSGSADVHHAQVAGTWWSAPVSDAWPVPPERRGTLAAKVVEVEAADHGHPLTAVRAAAVRTAARVFTRERALAESILLARRDDLDPQLRQDFAAAGIAHILAISGAHVGVLAGVLLLAMRMLGAGARTAPAGAAAATVAYVVLLGAPAAAARAALQILLLLSSKAMQRPADPLSLMALAALGLLTARPLSLLEPGFQLSFAGVFGLLSFRAPLGFLVPGRLPRPLRETLIVSLAASLATAPIVAWRFGIVSLIGPVTNIVAAPLMALALPAAALALTTGVLSTGAGQFLGGGAGLMLGVLRFVAEAAARPRWGHVWVPSFAVTAALAGGVFAFRFGPVPALPRGLPPRELRRAIRGRHLLRAGMATAAAMLIACVGPASSHSLEVHAIDVGQGDALAIRTPRGRWVLIDAGPRYGSFDAGRQRVAPYLRERGVTRIETLVLTHPDADHVGGAQWLWRAFEIGAVIDPAVPTGKDVYMDALRAAQARGTPWYAARAGREVRIDDVAIRILAPAEDLLDPSQDANDLSVVVRVEHGSFGALFLGDAPRRVENALVERLGSGVRSALVKVGHHGSRTSTGDSLLAAARPAVALLSVGRRNRYGHPAPEVVRRLRDHGVEVLRTDEDGSIEVRVLRDGAMEVRRR